MSSHGVSRNTRPRTEEQRKQDLEKLNKYRSLEDELRQRTSRKQYDTQTYHLTSKLLRFNPEYYTVWNVRRRCLTSGPLSKPSHGSSPSTASPSSSANAIPTPSSAASLSSSSTETPLAPGSLTTGTSGTTPDASSGPQDGQAADEAQEAIRSELAFTIPLLMEFPKCYWIWNFRLWVLAQATSLLALPVARSIWQEELGLVGKMLHRDRRNFHAWTYRSLVIEQLESAAIGGQSMVEPEFAYTTKMIEMDLSNFSAWHNRSKLIPRLLNERGAGEKERTKLLEDELNTSRNALNVGPEDQSLWYYHQYLILNLTETDHQRTFVPHLTADERTSFIRREVDEIKELLEDYADIKWIYDALIEYTEAICQVETRQRTTEETADVATWLRKLRELDPKRRGRWDDFEKELGLA